MGFCLVWQELPIEYFSSLSLLLDIDGIYDSSLHASHIPVNLLKAVISLDGVSRIWSWLSFHRDYSVFILFKNDFSTVFLGVSPHHPSPGTLPHPFQIQTPSIWCQWVLRNMSGLRTQSPTYIPPTSGQAVPYLLSLSCVAFGPRYLNLSLGSMLRKILVLGISKPFRWDCFSRQKSSDASRCLCSILLRHCWVIKCCCYGISSGLL